MTLSNIPPALRPPKHSWAQGAMSFPAESTNPTWLSHLTGLFSVESIFLDFPRGNTVSSFHQISLDGRRKANNMSNWLDILFAFLRPSNDIWWKDETVLPRGKSRKIDSTENRPVR